MPQRQQETAAAGIGENGLQGGVARFALPLDRFAQADEVDIRSRRDQASDGCLGENIPIPRRAELLHQPPRFAVDRPECRRRNIAPEQRTDRPQTAQGDAHLVHAFGVRSLIRHGVIFQKMMPAGSHQECDDVVDNMLRGNAEWLGFRRRLHDVERERIAAFRLAARADLQRRGVEQLRSEIEQDTSIAALQLEFDFGQHFLARAGLDRPLVECDFNRGIGQIELPRVPANFRRENRHQRVVG